VCALLLCLTSSASGASVYHDFLFGVQQTSNIVYGTGPTNNGATTMNLTLDLYRPTMIATPVPTSTPAIVLVHGGGFVGGDKLDMAPLAQAYAALGYVVASINYRMYFDLPPNSSPGPADGFTAPPPGYDTFADLQLGGNAINAAVDDASLAMDWLRDHAADYGVSPERIGIGGASAGAITSLLVGYNNPGNLPPTVVLSFMGSMYGTEAAIQPGGPPALLYHGDVDTQVPYAGEVAVAQRMTDVGVYHEFYVAPGVGHTLNQAIFAMNFGSASLLQHNIDFLANHLVPEPASLWLAASGVVALAAMARRRKRNDVDVSRVNGNSPL
ncbi:MAG: alpha/beta hydrolase fold domain-containing protein, partial [Pirellulales bacterium]